MKFKFLIIIGALALLQLKAQSNYNYTESFEDFPNPERGFYRYSETNTTNYTPLNANTLRGYRNISSVYSADYDVLSTLVFRYFILDNFINSTIDNTTLANIEADFQAARAGGVKLIPRFVYTTTANAGTCGSICPPFGDATKDRVLEHISQLKPILQEYSDVIAVLQMGFIGIWGEQYYTDHFGFPSSDGGDGKITNENWIKRNEVITALLDALPNDRMVQVRYPQQKQRFIYGLDAPTTSAPLTENEAFTETDKARLGMHNDCFLSSWTDVGTYSNYGNDNEGYSADTANLKPYAAEDSKYVPIGGETCQDQFSPHNKCEGFAVGEMDRMNYSYLNAHYNNVVNNHWVTGGCIDEIKRRLGYRFVLRNASLPNEVNQGQGLDISFNIDNVGFTSLYNPRTMELVLRNTNNDSVYHLPFSERDIRFWQEGNQIVNKTFTIPDSIPVGNYECFFNFPDPSENLYGNPDYSIRLANQGLWEATTGFNKLNHILSVTSGQTDICSDIELMIDGNNQEWSGIPIHHQNNNTYLKVIDDSEYLAFLLVGDTGTNNQFFIDADMDVNTGYSSLVWTNFGADYNIENGNFQCYTGTGNNDWSWGNISQIDYVIGSNTIELKINKNLINSTQFKIGYRNLDGNWAIQYNLPEADFTKNYAYQCQITSSNTVNEETIKVFPTITEGKFNIFYPKYYTSFPIKIYDSFGRLVQTETLTGSIQTFYLGNYLKKGIYFLMFKSQHQVYTFKMIKQ